MFDGEDALGQVTTMSLDNQRNLKLAIDKSQVFLAVAEQVADEMGRHKRHRRGFVLNDTTHLNYSFFKWMAIDHLSGIGRRRGGWR